MSASTNCHSGASTWRHYGVCNGAKSTCATTTTRPTCVVYASAAATTAGDNKRINACNASRHSPTAVAGEVRAGECDHCPVVERCWGRDGLDVVPGESACRSEIRTRSCRWRVVQNRVGRPVEVVVGLEIAGIKCCAVCVHVRANVCLTTNFGINANFIDVAEELLARVCFASTDRESSGGVATDGWHLRTVDCVAGFFSVVVHRDGVGAAVDRERHVLPHTCKHCGVGGVPVPVTKRIRNCVLHNSVLNTKLVGVFLVDELTHRRCCNAG